MHLNHMHLSVTDVAAASAFFVRHFAFTLQETRGNHGLAILSGADRFVLVLMKLPRDADPAEVYPPLFHVGFLSPDETQVRTMHAAMQADALDVSAVEFQRGGARFYCRAPGGLLVEVGHDPAG